VRCSLQLQGESPAAIEALAASAVRCSACPEAAAVQVLQLLCAHASTHAEARAPWI